MSERTMYPTARAAARAQARELARTRLIRLAVALTLTVLALLAPRFAHGQDWRTISQAREVGGEKSLDVDVRYAAGQLRIAPAAAGTLYRMNMRYDADVLTPRTAFSGNRLRVGMGEASIKGRSTKGGLLDLRLGPDVPIDLDIEFGAAEAELDLGGLRITNAEISTGASRTKLTVSTPNRVSCRRFKLEVGAAQFEATKLGNLNAQRISLQGGVGEMTLDFSGDWRQDMRGSIEIGLGSLTLMVPRGLGVSIRRKGLLATFDSQGLVKRGEVYYSENFESARYKLTLDIEAALGSIRVVWLDS